MIEVIRNQPIQTRFNDGYCCDNHELMQLVKMNDDQRIQVKLTPYGVSAALDVATFYRVNATLQQGGILMTGGSSATKTVSITAGKRYRVQFTVKFNNIDNSGGYRVYLNGQYLILPDASRGRFSIISGTITTYLTVSASANHLLSFATSGSDTSVVISAITIDEMSDCYVSVLDEGLNLIKNFNNDLTIYQRNTDVATIMLNWADVDYTGVCFIRIYDPLAAQANLLVNPTFATSLSSWENTDDSALEWIFDSGVPNKAAYAGSGSDGNNRLSQSMVLENNAIYTLAFTLSNIVTLGNGVFIYFLTDDGDELNKQPYIINGVQSWTLNLINDCGGFTSGRLVIEPLHAIDLLKVFNLSLTLTTDMRNISNPFLLGDNHPFTLMLVGICNQSAFGFEFSHFQHRARVKGKIQYKEYPDITEVYDFSDNEAEILDSTARKFYEVTIHGNPEYIHDAVRLIRLSDYFFINGKEYIKEAGYDLKPTEGILNSSSTFLVRQKIGIDNNYFASGYVDVKYASG